MPHDSQVINMNKLSVKLAHPSGLWRLIFRFPIWLYRLHLGWLFGERALLLEHIGRKSGVVRKAVVEVVDHDVQGDSYIIASAWGNQSDWYKNIRAQPSVNVEVGTKRFAAFAKILSADEAAQHLNIYATKHPFAFRQLGMHLFGYKSHDKEQIIKSLTEAIPFVEFIPASEKTD
jgi:deazaflavin-dependent oxidoreductase (nitroreductase family)